MSTGGIVYVPEVTARTVYTTFFDSRERAERFEAIVAHVEEVERPLIVGLDPVGLEATAEARVLDLEAGGQPIDERDVLDHLTARVATSISTNTTVPSCMLPFVRSISSPAVSRYVRLTVAVAADLVVAVRAAPSLGSRATCRRLVAGCRA